MSAKRSTFPALPPSFRIIGGRDAKPGWHARLKELYALPRSSWRQVELDVPTRLYRTPRVFEQRIRLLRPANYPGGPASFLK